MRSPPAKVARSLEAKSHPPSRKMSVITALPDQRRQACPFVLAGLPDGHVLATDGTVPVRHTRRQQLPIQSGQVMPAFRHRQLRRYQPGSPARPKCRTARRSALDLAPQETPNLRSGWYAARAIIGLALREMARVLTPGGAMQVIRSECVGLRPEIFLPNFLVKPWDEWRREWVQRN